MNDYKKLRVWQRSLKLSEQVYIHTKSFPESELFGLTRQMRRCSVSIFSNIAEGAGRNSPADFDRFLGMARGSAFELDAQIELAILLNYLNRDTASTLSDETVIVQKMLYKLMGRISKLEPKY